eukprot:32672-Amphidinium_carterae.1
MSVDCLTARRVLCARCVSQCLACRHTRDWSDRELGPAVFPVPGKWVLGGSAVDFQGMGGSRCCNLVDTVEGVVVAGVAVAV